MGFKTDIFSLGSTDIKGGHRHTPTIRVQKVMRTRVLPLLHTPMLRLGAL